MSIIEQERADFEAWFATKFDADRLVDKTSAGGYGDAYALTAWLGYQAGRAALQSHPIAPASRELALWAYGEAGADPELTPGLAQLLQHFGISDDAPAALQSQDREDALVQAIQEAIALLGPEAPSCSGCEYEWNHALRVLHEAIDHARRIEEGNNE